MSLRARIIQLHHARCSDVEIATFLRCGRWYVRQALRRPEREGKSRERVRIEELA